MPLVTSLHDGRRRVIAAVDSAAEAAGLYPGMDLAQAKILIPGLAVHEATPALDEAALQRLTEWCLRYAPLVSAAPPDGVWIDITGTAHLHDGEKALLHGLVARLAIHGVTARAAIADTPGAAHALARFRMRDATVAASGETAAAIASLPIEALRLTPDILSGLRLLGFEQVGKLAATPRAPLVRRFGPLLSLRLDQASGAVFEPIVPIFPLALVQARLTFVDPLMTAESFLAVIDRLAGMTCTDLEKAGQGARRLDLLFERVDGTIQAVRVGTARASRNSRHLARMLAEKIELIDPGLGVEAMRLIVSLADPLAYVQDAVHLTQDDPPTKDLAPLIDRLANRLGARRVFRDIPVESDVPERSVRRVPALAPRRGTKWPAELPRPVRLLDPPQPVDTMALLPDYPPVAFTWRRVRHRIRRADGPERIAGEWWRHDAEMRLVRDYFRLEDEDGRRFWLFRRGDGADTATGDMRWFLHGFF